MEKPTLVTQTSGLANLRTARLPTPDSRPPDSRPQTPDPQTPDPGPCPEPSLGVLVLHN